MIFIKKYEDYLKEGINLYKTDKPHFIHSVEEVNLPNGIYDGIQGGYHVDVIGTDIGFKTNIGVRCSNCPCKVKIENKKAYLI